MLKISVITVVYNEETKLESTIKSVMAQSYPAIEYIVIDGASIDGTRQILEQYREHIDILISEPDQGIYDAMNKGISMASGDWLHFLNAADLYTDGTAIERLLNYATPHPDVNVIYTKSVPNIHVEKQEVSYHYLAKRALNHQNMIFSKQLFEKELYDTRYSYLADYKHLLNVMPLIKSLGLSVDFVHYDPHGVSSDPANRPAIWKERAKILSRSIMPAYLRFPAIAYAYLAYLYRAIQKNF